MIFDTTRRKAFERKRNICAIFLPEHARKVYLQQNTLSSCHSCSRTTPLHPSCRQQIYSTYYTPEQLVFDHVLKRRNNPRTFFFWVSFYCPLLGRTRSRVRCWATIRLSHRPEPSGRAQSTGRSVDWTLNDNMVDDLLFCATLPARRGGHTPIVQAGAETPDTGAEAVKLDPRCSRKGHFIPEGWVPVSQKQLQSLVGLSNHTAFHRWSAQSAARMLLLSDEMMSCCAAGTNGCLDLRRRTSALGGQVSSEWSRCPGAMAWRAKDSVTLLRRSSAGWMPARIGRLSADVGRRHPVTIPKTSSLWWQGQWGGCEHCGTGP